MSAPIRRGHYDRRRPDHFPSCSQCCPVQRNFQIDYLHLIGSCDARSDWLRDASCSALLLAERIGTGYSALLLAERSATGCSRQSPHCQAMQHCCLPNGVP